MPSRTHSRGVAIPGVSTLACILISFGPRFQHLRRLAASVIHQRGFVFAVVIEIRKADAPGHP